METSLAVTMVGGRCYWHLAGEGQGCRYTPANTQDGPPQWG